MKRYLLFLIAMSLLALTGCETIKQNATEPKARDAAQWVRTRSGFIQNAVSAITHVAVYSSEKDTFERERTLEIMHAFASNINLLVSNGTVNPDDIKDALKINEPYFGPLMGAVANLIQVEMGTFQENGYAELSIEILKAVSRGIADGTVTK